MSRIWQQNFNKLLAFKAEFGHVNVPKSYVDKKLARLVTTIRQQKRYKTLKPERELALLQIGFDFDPIQSLWEKSYKKVCEFYRMNGHSSPYRRSKNEHERALGDWVHRMHKLIRLEELSDDKVQKLKLINIDGHPSNYHLSRNGLPIIFESMLGKLKKQIRQYGQNIHHHNTNPELYNWLLFQQQRIQAALIPPKEYSALMKSDFDLKQEISSTQQDVSNY